MRKILISLILTAVLAISSCASPTVPSEVTSDAPLNQNGTVIFNEGMQSGGHHLLGFWELAFDFENSTAEAIPQRFYEGHFNVRKFMEEGPCYQCLTLLNFSLQPDETFTVDVRFEHPFPGVDNLSGFDVRGIAIFNGTYNYTASGLIGSDRSLGDMELLNADGFTNLFNPIEFEPGSNLPILCYSQGKIATYLSNPATLNGFKAYYPDTERRLFRAGESDTQTYHIARPAATKIRVGYAVDASWDIPLTKPVTNPVVDFGPEANCLEAYKIEASIGTGMMPGCGFAPYQVDVYDHQGSDTIAMVTFESPDLLSGIIADGNGVDMGDFKRYTGNLPNELEVGEGEYKILVGAVDVNDDPFLGNIVAYTITTAVVDYVDIDYDTSWRKHGKTLDNNNYNPHETEIGTTLSEAWRYEFGSGMGCVFESTPTLGPFGVYVVVNKPYDQKIAAFDIETGDLVWDRIIKFVPDNAIYRGVPTIGNCELYVGGSSVFCLDSEDGDQIWAFEGENTQYVNGGPVVTEDLVLIWGMNNTLFAFDQYTGESEWQYGLEDWPSNPGTPVVEDGVVYGGDSRGHVFALDLYTGSEIWQVDIPAGGPLMAVEIWAAPILADGLLWIGSFNCHLYGMNLTNGNVEVDVPLGDQIAWASPAYDGTYIYQATTYDSNYWQFFDGPFKVMAIQTDGTVAWTFPGVDTEGFWSSPVVANGIVWVPSDAGVIYMLDPATGNPVGPGSYALDGPIKGGMTILDGKLYVMDTLGTLYCLENE